MKKTRIAHLVFISAGIIFCASCKNKVKEEREASTETITPVTVTTIAHDTLKETVELNAVSSFLLKTNVKVNVNGYIQKVNMKPGDYVNKGEELFELKTKESMSLDNTINRLDSGFHFSGIVHIKAPGSGYITSLDHQSGDYVQDGDQVATISSSESFI